MAFAFGHVLSDDALRPRAVGLKLGASSSAISNRREEIGLAVTALRDLIE